MSTKALLITAISIAFLAAGCGGGGDGTYVAPASGLNAFESDLVGTYALQDFFLIQPGDGGYDPSSFEAFAGELVLEPNGTAVVTLEMCEDAQTVTHACDRHFTWTADAGWIYLECVEGGADAWASYARGGMGSMTTEFRVPTNHTDVGQLLVEDGYELYTWRRVQ